jgi:hypothetical protein
MADLTIRVPGDHVDDVRDSLLHAYAGVAEALRAAALHHVASRTGADTVLAHRSELLDLDDALAQLELDYAPASRPVELTAHPEVLADAVAGALRAAIERFQADVERLWRGAGGAAAASASLERATTLLALLHEVMDGPPAS